jgi:hypothetical protein
MTLVRMDCRKSCTFFLVVVLLLAGNSGGIVEMYHNNMYKDFRKRCGMIDKVAKRVDQFKEVVNLWFKKTFNKTSATTSRRMPAYGEGRK